MCVVRGSAVLVLKVIPVKAGVSVKILKARFPTPSISVPSPVRWRLMSACGWDSFPSTFGARTRHKAQARRGAARAGAARARGGTV